MSFLAYLRSHWTGSQGLAWSFWVNLVGVRVAMTLGQALVLENMASATSPSNTFLVIFLVFAHLAVFLWQVVGVLRAGDRHLRELGSVTNTWGAQLGILIAVMFVLSDVWRVWLMTGPAADTISISEQLAREREEKYLLRLSEDTTVLEFSGKITLGVTKAVAALLASNPDVTTLSLSSSGGNIYEARGLAGLARKWHLNTLAVETCSSACTIAFIGGASRRLAPGARLGFHQYQLDAAYDVPFANAVAEQERDRELFRSGGVKEWFVARMYQEHPSEMWYPSIAELQRAGVIVYRQ